MNNKEQKIITLQELKSTLWSDITQIHIQEVEIDDIPIIFIQTELDERSISDIIVNLVKVFQTPDVDICLLTWEKKMVGYSKWKKYNYLITIKNSPFSIESISS